MLPVPSSRWKTLASAAVVLIGRGDCQGPGCGGRISPYGFVLSCRDKGAIAKCIDRMGYKPWRTVTEVTVGEGDARAVTLKLMQDR